MSQTPYALALAAGMLATVNPCGFALLPTYVSLVVAAEPTRAVSATPPAGRRGAVGRALTMTAAMTGGFVAVFGTFGLLVAPLALSVERYLPWLTIVIGAALVALGGWLLAGREVYLAAPKLRTGRPTRSLGALFGYGVSYAVASLSCTIGPFLALTTSALRTTSLPGALGVFGAYAAGMGLVVGVLTLAAALTRDTLAARLRRTLPYVSRAGGVLLIVAGGYVAYYGWYEIRVLAGQASNDPVIDTATHLQATLTRWLDATGPGPLTVAMLLLAAAATLAGRRHRRTRTAPPAPSQPAGAQPAGTQRAPDAG